ncbi:MAG: N-acetylmuramoyl-L-alanine amidase [Lachnospiraceae bacterium]
MKLLLNYFMKQKIGLKFLSCTLIITLLFSVFTSIQTDSGQASSNGILIVIDPGHQTGSNKGVLDGYDEGVQMYILSTYEKMYLQQYGFDVILTRDDQSSPSLTARGDMAVNNASGYQTVIFMSNHTNAASASATGVVAITSKHLSSENSNFINYMLDTVANEMNKVTGVTYNRHEIQTRDYNLNPAMDYYGVIRSSVGYATNAAQAQSGPVQYSFILEHGFHTNPTECKYLMDTENLKNLAAAKAQAIASYFNRTTTNSSTNISTEQTGYVYQVPEADALNVRSEANPYINNVLTTLLNNSPVNILSSTTSVDGNLWYQVRTNQNIVGYVNSYYIRKNSFSNFVGEIRNDWVRVETAPGSNISIKGWPYLGQGNLIDVLEETTSSNHIAYYKVLIANTYIGYVPASQIIKHE